MIDIAEAKRRVTAALLDGETEVLLCVPGIYAEGFPPRQASASGLVSFHQDYSDSPVGDARHAVEVWAVFKVADLQAFFLRHPAL